MLAGDKQSLAQPAKLNLAVGPGLGGGELELVGELGVAHLHSGAGVGVDGIHQALQGGVLGDVDVGPVNLEIVNRLAVVIHPVAVLVHPVAGLVQVIGGAVGALVLRGAARALQAVVLGENALRLVAQDIRQLLARIDEVGVPALESQRLHSAAAQAQGGALISLEGQLAVRVVHPDLVLAESVVQLGLEGLLELRTLVLRSIITEVDPIHHIGHADLLGGAVEGDAQLLAAAPRAVLALGAAQVLIGGHLLGQITGIAQHVLRGVLLHLAGGAADLHRIAVAQPVREGDPAVLVGRHLDGLVGGGALLEAVLGVGVLDLAQLLIDGVGQLFRAVAALHLVEVLQLVKVDGEGGAVFAAVLEGQGAGHGAHVQILGDVKLLAGDGGHVPHASGQAGHGIGGGLGHLLHTVDLDIAGALAAGGDFVLIGAHDGGIHRAAEEALAEQVGFGGVGGVLVVEVHRLVDDAAVGLLLPLNPGALLRQVFNLQLDAGDRVFDHGLGIHAAGQAAEHISVPINAAGVVAAVA